MAGLLVPPGTVRVVIGDRPYNGEWRVDGNQVCVDSAYGSTRAPLRNREPKVAARAALEKLVRGWRR